MPERTKTHLSPKDIDVSSAEINNGVYRIAGLIDAYWVSHLTSS